MTMSDNRLAAIGERVKSDGFLVSTAADLCLREIERLKAEVAVLRAVADAAKRLDGFHPSHKCFSEGRLQLERKLDALAAYDAESRNGQ